MKCILLISMMAATLTARAGDWRQFRGPSHNGVVDDPALPVALTPKNLKWSVPLPGRGLSGAIVVGDRVFVTCSSGPSQTRLHVVCLNAKDGSTRWHRLKLE